MAERALQLLCLRFTVDEGQVPQSLKDFEKSKPVKPAQEKMVLPRGRLLYTDPVPMCNVGQLFADMAIAQCKFVDAAYGLQQIGEREYHNVGVMFSPKQFAVTTPEFDKVSEGLIADILLRYGEQSVWTLRMAWENHFADMTTRQVIPGRYVLDLSFNGRQQVVDRSGAPLMVWPEDERGVKIKTGTKVTFRGKYQLRLQDGAIKIPGWPNG